MSELSLPEFRKMSGDLLSIYGAATNREREAWGKDFSNALMDLPYIESARASSVYDADRLLDVKCKAKLSSMILQSVKMDLARIWTERVAEDAKAYHAFQDFEGGFEFFFTAAAKTGGAVSGSIRVTANR